MRATRVQTHDELAEAAPGSFRFHRSTPEARPVGMTFVCPCGCGRIAVLGFEPGRSTAAHWAFDGNEERPTLSPIIRCTAFDCCWTGYLKAGEWREV